MKTALAAARLSFASAILLLSAAATVSAADPAMPLEAALQQLSERHGFALTVAEDARALPVVLPEGGDASPDALLERLLRTTSHVLVRDGERIVRVIVLAPGTGAADIVAGAESAPLSPQAAQDQLAEDRRAVTQGLSPDTGRPTALQAALHGAMEQAERERAIPLLPLAP